MDRLPRQSFRRGEPGVRPGAADESSAPLSFALFTPACVDFMLETVPGEYLATGHLLFLAIGQGAGAVAGNALSGFLAEYLGMGWMFRTVGVLALLASGLALCCAKMLNRRKGLS